MPTVYQVELLAKDGRRVPVEISSWLVVRDGALAGICGVARLLGPPADPATVAATSDDGVAAARLAAQAELRLGLDVIDTRLAEEGQRDHVSDRRELLEEIRASVSRAKSLAAEAFA